MNSHELRRRRRVVGQYWAKELPAAELRAIERYLDGGPVPRGYEHIDKALR